MARTPFKVTYQVQLFDKQGKLRYRKSGISRSLLKNFMLWLQGKFQVTACNATPSYTATDTGNIGRNFEKTGTDYSGAFGHFGAAVNDQTRGIRIGTSKQAVSPTDVELIGLITHGTGNGQMVYNAQTYESVQTAGNTTSFRITRSFTNNSGASIGVNEIGAAMCLRDTGGTDRYLLYLRDVLPSTVTVPDASTFTVRYTFSVTA